MSDSIAVEFDGVGKMFLMHRNRVDSFLDVTGLDRLLPWRRMEVDKFWALRDVSFRLESGSRLGIVGRNGAGKTTLLKLITGNVMPTEGRVEVQGEVQALLEAGAGFHPEFTGYENIRASLVHHAVEPERIDAIIEEIADFTELGEFLSRPFKTYSAGMQARLVFTTATAVSPDILIIDEILGAGDAYFAGKSRGRMRALVESGASVLLVSHALDQILQFCDEALWLERGRIVARGPSLEVVKAYEEFVRTLQDRRLKAVNRRRKFGVGDSVDVEQVADAFVVALKLKGEPGVRVDVTTVELRADDEAEETLRVGGVQDTDPAHLASVYLAGSDWSDPDSEDDTAFRSLTTPNGHDAALGQMVFRSFGLAEDKHATFVFRYRLVGEGCLEATVSRNGQAVFCDVPLVTGQTGWQETELVLVAGTSESQREVDDGAPKSRSKKGGRRKPVLRRWPGEGSLRILDVQLQDPSGEERAVFRVGTPMTLSIRYRAEQSRVFPLVHVAAMYRVDGIKVSQHASAREEVDLAVGREREARLEFAPLNLADGRYVLSVALYRSLDPTLIDEPQVYDLIDRSYEFEVVGNPPLRTSLFVLPARWRTSELSYQDVKEGASDG